MNRDRLGAALAWARKTPTERSEITGGVIARLGPIQRDTDEPGRATNRKRKFIGYVYVIKAGEFYKIGVAKDVEKRRATMQIGCPYDLSIIYAFPSSDPFRLERRIHFKLRSYHFRAEWFKLSDELLEQLVAKIRANSI